MWLDGGKVPLCSRCRLSLDTCKDRRKEEAERIIKFFDALFSFIIGTAALGAGFTFPTILAKLDPAPTCKFQDNVLRFLAISWLLFILALASAGFFASIIAFGKDFAKYNLNFGTDHLDEHCKLRCFGGFWDPSDATYCSIYVPLVCGGCV